MAGSSFSLGLLLLAATLLLAAPARQVAADADPVVDFANPAWNSSDFVLRNLPGQPPVANASGSHLNAAISAQFPALSGQGISVLLGHMAPCAVHTPHTHMRATEIVYIIAGQAYIGFTDSYEQWFANTVVAGDVAVIPRGMWHVFQNTGTEDLVFLSAFNSESPGAIQATTGFSLLPREILRASFGLNYVSDKLIDLVFFRDLNSTQNGHLTMGVNCTNVGPAVP